MDPSHIYPVAPGLVLSAAFFVGMPFYAMRRRQPGYAPHPDIVRRRPSFLATHFMMGYLSWLLDPVERALSSQRVSPNTISFIALLCCAVAGGLAGAGFLATAAWIYVLGGVLDVLDGRVARRTQRTSPSGALLDSVLDRWGEFFMLGGLAFQMRSGYGVAAILVCLVGSQMVSYTRARAEALGVRGDSGAMQRAERMVGVSLALLIGSVGTATGAFQAQVVIAMILFAIGLASTVTSVGRLVEGMRSLDAEAQSKGLVPPPAPEPRKTPAAPVRGLAAPPAAQRISSLQPRE